MVGNRFAKGLVTGVGCSIVSRSSHLVLDGPPFLDVSAPREISSPHFSKFASAPKVSSLEDGDGRRGGQAVGVFKASTENFQKLAGHLVLKLNGELVAADEPVVASKPFLDATVVKDGQRDRHLPNKSGRIEIFREASDHFDEWVASETSPRGRKGSSPGVLDWNTRQWIPYSGIKISSPVPSLRIDEPLL